MHDFLARSFVEGKAARAMRIIAELGCLFANDIDILAKEPSKNVI
jgi:hypothetical protein